MSTRKTYYITFGQRYRYEKHPRDTRIHPDGWVKVQAPSLGEAMKIAKAFFGNNYSNVYDKKTFHPFYYPKGCLFRLNGRKGEEMKRPRVFIINESGHDFSAAEEFGDLVFITKGRVVGRQLNKHFRVAEEALRDFSSEDYLLCTSLQLLNFVVGYVIGWRHVSPIQILYYHNGGYIVLRYDFSTLLNEGKEIIIKEGATL